MTPKLRAMQIVLDSEYVERWFDAKNFFNTTYTSEVRKDKYFITCDHFMNNDIWALREITVTGIETLVNANTKQLCLDELKGL